MPPSGRGSESARALRRLLAMPIPGSHRAARDAALSERFSREISRSVNTRPRSGKSRQDRDWGGRDRSCPDPGWRRGNTLYRRNCSASLPVSNGEPGVDRVHQADGSISRMTSGERRIPFERSSRVRHFPWRCRSSTTVEQVMAMRKRNHEVFANAARALMSVHRGTGWRCRPIWSSNR